MRWLKLSAHTILLSLESGSRDLYTARGVVVTELAQFATEIPIKSSAYLLFQPENI